MPYLTPDSIPEGADCRTLLIPASSDWLAIVSGALTELVKTYNWAQFGSVTVEEAVNTMQVMIDQYYEGCQSCVLPGNSPLFRLNENGEIEQLVDGEWVPPQGDYELPPTPPRTEPTLQERRCLAAANAAAVFEQLYEEISDAFQEGMTFQQWTEFLTATLITLLGTIFGLVIAPLVLIGVLIVGVIYETLEFITADVWTTEFTDMFVCLLYECATDAGGDVVHFDYPCLMNRLAAVTDIFDPTFAQIRLFGQISFIMQILGAQSLDAMGATTGVETADCAECEQNWCRMLDFRIDEYGFVVVSLGHWTSGVGFETDFLYDSTNSYRYIDIANPDFHATITNMEFGFSYTKGSVDAGGGNTAIGVFDQTFTQTFFNYTLDAIPPVPDSPLYWVFTGAPESLTTLFAQLITGILGDVDADPGGSGTLIYIKICGTGTPPELGVPCDEGDDCAE